MSGARGADLALLAGPPSRLCLLGRAAVLEGAAREAGWAVVPVETADVCVTDPARAAVGAAAGTPRIVVVGGAPRRALAGYRTCDVVAWPRAWDPVALAPRTPSALRRLFGAAPAGLARRAAGWGAALCATWFLPSRIRLTVAAREAPLLPWPVAAVGGAAQVEAPWLLFRGHGDDLQRIVLTVLPTVGAPTAYKIGRVPAAEPAFTRDQAGLALAAAAGPRTRAHAPVLLAREQVAGLPLAVETWAPGRRLSDVLGGRQAVHVRVAHVHRIVQWLLAVAEETTAPAEVEVRRARAAAARAARGPADVASRLPVVLEHADLGTWNVHVTERDFTALDWESARRAGMPLGDVVYLLVDALVLLERPRGDRLPHMLAVLSGRSRWSPLLFRAVRHAAAVSGLDAQQVAAAVTLTWLHHATSPAAREAAGGTADEPAAHARLAGPWLEDPDLGWTWSLWRS